MRIYRARYMLLGLTVCCLMTVEIDGLTKCFTDFTDPASKAHRTEIVIEATVMKLIPYQSSTALYNATVRILKLRKVLKGRRLVPKRLRRLKEFNIGPFGVPMKNWSKCIGPIEINRRYIFYVNRTTDLYYFRTTALSNNSTKRARKAIRKIVCKKCGPKPPVITLTESVTIESGKKFSLRCFAKGIPKPKLKWFKDSRTFKSIRGVRIKRGRRGLMLRVRKARAHMSGEYMCQASNLLKFVKKIVRVVVRPAPTTKHPATTPAYITKKKATADESARKKKACENQTYCVNGGQCVFTYINQWPRCRCDKKFSGERCQERNARGIRGSIQTLFKLKHDRLLVVIGIVIAVFVFIIICLASYILARKKRYEFHQRRQNKQALKERDWHNSSNQALLRDEVDHGANKRTGVFRLAMSTQTDEVAHLNNLDENRIISNNFSPNIFTSPGSERPLSGADRSNGRSRLNGVVSSEGASTNEPRHIPDIVLDDGVDRLTTNNVPLGRVERFADPAESVPLYVDESDAVHSLLHDDDSSIRETDILDVDATDESSDEENGRLFCENADNGCRIDDDGNDTGLFYRDHRNVYRAYNGSAAGSKANSDGRRSVTGRDDDKTSLLNEVDFVHGEHPLSDRALSDSTPEKQSSGKLASEDGDEKAGLCGNKPTKRDDTRHPGDDEPEYAISESSFSDGSTPTGEVLDDVADLEIPETCNGFPRRSPSPMNIGDSMKPYAAFPYAFNHGEDIIANAHTPGSAKHNPHHHNSHRANDTVFRNWHADDSQPPYV